MTPDGKWFTCTPVSFVGDERFFARDSGLLCKGFQEIGVDCRAIMPLPEWPGDHTDDLIRTDHRNLRNPDWWRSLNGEGVVFYGWGAGKYAPIAKAIKAAGLHLVSHMDTAGMLGILNGVAEYASSQWRITQGESNSRIKGANRFALKLGYAFTIGLFRNDMRRASHLRQADIIGAISPVAVERISRICRVYGGDELARRVSLIPHPNAPYMTYDPAIPKEQLLVAVGRWDDLKIKGTSLLMETCERVLADDAHLRIEIYGTIPPAVEKWHGALADSQRDRIELAGRLPNSGITRALQRARVVLCTSLREGYHTVSAESLCCGASVVGPDVPEIPSLKWFTDGPYGRLAPRRGDALAEAVMAELAAWDSGERDPAHLSSHWASLLHAPSVARRILELVEKRKSRAKQP